MLVYCFRNEFTTCASNQMVDGFGALEFGLRLDILVKEILTCFLLSLSYSTGEITMFDCQDGIRKRKIIY